MAGKEKKILVIGASGMLGNAVLRVFAQSPGYHVVGSVRSTKAQSLLPDDLKSQVITGVDVDSIDCVSGLLADVEPDVVINCVGLVKQLSASKDPLQAISINALLPHRLAHLSQEVGARLVHMSTDCVFSGRKGMYVEAEFADAGDLYGRSKLLGEVDYPNAITLRTSIIGRELDGAHSLVDWFLTQEGRVKGFRRAVFSGLPTVEIASLIRDYVIPHPELHGLYHVSADPISKFDLLTLIAKAYDKNIEIVPDDELVIDRSLNSDRFRLATGFLPKQWPELINSMRSFN